MDSQVNYIRQRLSLRKPLANALELTARITDKLSIKRPPTDPDNPFMGSGTTALASVKLGRHYIGSEISEKYVQMANDKIQIEQSQLKLF